MLRLLEISAALILIATSAWAQTCDTGFVLESSGGLYNCRNPICEAGINMYGEMIDAGKTDSEARADLALLLTDADGKARPTVKGPDGKWVGWTIGAYQCPPDTIGLHPNPDWVDSGNLPGQPQNIRIIANMVPKG